MSEPTPSALPKMPPMPILPPEFPTLATLWCFLSLIAMGVGGWFLYADPEKVVGGDAFNYLLSALRGVGILAAGVIFALFAVCSVQFSLLGRLITKRT